MGNQVTRYDKQMMFTNNELFKVQGEALRESLIHRSIGALTYRNKNREIEFGSAVLLSENLILTAAHNIFNRRLKAENGEFRFYIGVEGFAQEYFEIDGWRYPQQFQKCWDEERLQFDYAVMKLKQPILAFDRFLPLNVPCHQCVWQKELNVFGFPCSQQNEALLHQRNIIHLYQFGQSRVGQLVLYNPSFFQISYRISALPGMNGCPVIMEDSIIAIHLGGVEKYNTGRIVDLSLIKDISKWKQSLQAESFQLRQEQECPHRLLLMQRRMRQIHLQDYGSLLVLDLSSNWLEWADLCYCPYLIRLNLSCNRLSFIDLTSNTQLRHLNLYRNKLQKMDLSANINLENVHLSDNKITQVNLKKNFKLTNLWMNYNQLTSIDLRKNTQIVTLDLGSNSIYSIDLTKNKKLTRLWLQNNRLHEINLKNNCLLESLELRNNSLREINITNSKNIQDLRVQTNQLKHLSLTVSEKVAKQKYFQFALNQHPHSLSVCQVLILCEGKLAKEKAVEVVNKWQMRYNQKDFSFSII